MKNIVYNEFPISSERLFIKESTIDELILIRSETKFEDEHKMTCRPIIKRKENELNDYYKDILEQENLIIFSIIRKKDGFLVAKVSYSDYNPRNRSLEVGYYVIPRFRKNGYIKEALISICDVLFENNNINKIYAQTASFNIESIKLLEKLNFKKDATLRNHHELDKKLYDDYIFSMLCNEWKFHRQENKISE